FRSRITHTFVNGTLCYELGKYGTKPKAERLTFNR
ncbi:MAG: hypothetical protein ACI9KI_001743, partial [Patiriisocius sp.]